MGDWHNGCMSVSGALLRDLQDAGYYPHLAANIINDVLFDEPVVEHCVHMETHMDFESIHRHVTAFVLTETRLILVHVDDEPAGPDQKMRGVASVEDIPFDRIRTVLLSRIYENPADFAPGQKPVEVGVNLGWESVRRLEVFPESCADPQCDADHGYGGTSVPEDVNLRVSAQAEGQSAVDQAERFALTLKKLVYRARRDAS